MPSDFIGIDISGLEELQAALKKLPKEAADMGIDEASDYLLKILRLYPSQKRITRQQAYGAPFFTDKQRRFFFAALKDGRIGVPYRRTMELQSGWKQIDKGVTSILVNDTPYADLVMGDGQSRMAQLGGWKKLEDITRERTARIIEKFSAGVKKAIRKLGL